VGQELSSGRQPGIRTSRATAGLVGEPSDPRSVLFSVVRSMLLRADLRRWGSPPRSAKGCRLVCINIPVNGHSGKQLTDLGNRREDGRAVGAA